MIKNTKVQFITKVGIKALLLIFGALGLIFTFTGDGFMGTASALLYFTIQSNITIMIVAAVFLVNDILHFLNKRTFINNTFIIIKFVFTVAITLTFLVFFIVLAPTTSISYLLSIGNFSVHFLVPIFAIADFLLFDYNIKLKKYEFFWGAAMPMYYLIFSIVGSYSGMQFSGNLVPYFFLDYQKLGWFSFSNGMGVFYWIIILTVVVVAISFLYSYLAELIAKRVKSRNEKNTTDAT